MSSLAEHGLNPGGGGDENRQARLLSVPEVAKQLSLSRDTVYRLIYTGRLFGVKSGGRRLVPDFAVDEYINLLVKEAEAE